uniref:F-box domain-containing protein n=2 Tax=Lactuca sativa TaxID=4236 RepID=A0A9R1V0R2_LACSA|nr:hypothetical protein LSAT_V11C700352220 [Lactuca sativa]
MEEGEDDRISALPDCLLLEILSRLPSIKRAIRTGTLSKRWKHLWTSVPTLCFNDYTRTLSDFISSVDKTLTQCHQLMLKKFLVCTTYDTRYVSQVNSWIRYAISCNVEDFSLTLWNMKFEAEFLLEQIFFISSSFTELTLRGCIFNPVGAINWKNLRNLCITWGNLHEDLIENILSGSPLLETLVLRYCYGYKRLNITSKSVKNLVFSGHIIRDDDDDDDDDDDGDITYIIEINAPNILSLTIEDDVVLWRLLLLNVSSLVEANLDFANMGHNEIIPEEVEEEMLKGLLLKLHHVKELKIGDLCSEVLSRLEAKGFIFPSNMKFPDVIPPLCSDSNSNEIERCSCLTMVLKLMCLID